AWISAALQVGNRYANRALGWQGLLVFSKTRFETKLGSLIRGRPVSLYCSPSWNAWRRNWVYTSDRASDSNCLERFTEYPRERAILYAALPAVLASAAFCC